MGSDTGQEVLTSEGGSETGGGISRSHFGSPGFLLKPSPFLAIVKGLVSSPFVRLVSFLRGMRLRLSRILSAALCPFGVACECIVRYMMCFQAFLFPGSP